MLLCTQLNSKSIVMTHVSICPSCLPALFDQPKQSHVVSNACLHQPYRTPISYTSNRLTLASLVPSTPAVPLNPRLGILIEISISVDPSSRNAVSRAQTNGGATHDTTNREAAAEGLTTT